MLTAEKTKFGLYEELDDFRDVKCNPAGEMFRKHKKIEAKLTGMGFKEQPGKYEEFKERHKPRRMKMYNNYHGNTGETTALLLELRKMLVDKIRNSREVESLSIESLTKLVSLSCRAIMDISKAERDLDMDKLNEHSWGELADAIRNDPDAFKLAQQLSNKIHDERIN